MMLEPEPPGQQPIIMITTACTGMTWKANAKANAVKGMMPNWQRNPMMMPQGFLMWPHSFVESTVQPMENMTIASMMVSVVLIATPRISLKLLGGTRQSGPEHTVARESHLMSTADVAMAARLGVRSRCCFLLCCPGRWRRQWEDGPCSPGFMLQRLGGKESKINQYLAFYGVSVQKPMHVKRIILKCHSRFDHNCNFYCSLAH